LKEHKLQIARRLAPVKGLRCSAGQLFRPVLFQKTLANSLDLPSFSTRIEPTGLFNGALSMGILAALVIGAIAGWLAGLIVRGAGFGLIGNIVIGIIGALVASWILPQLGVSLGGSAFHDIINATIGAVIVLVILSLVKRA
jgi:uncharacterized membrane protein YeaQ/YmgE (transglycosylase-associated protein family)